MRFILRLSFLFFGLSLALIALINLYLRQEPSSAYWIVGEFYPDSNSKYLVLSTPNGAIQHTVVTGTQLNGATVSMWLPDGLSFLYYWRTTEPFGAEIRLYSLERQESIFLSKDVEFDESHLLPTSTIPAQDAQAIIIQPDDAAIYSLSNDGQTLRQMTPFHDGIWTGYTWSADGEWLYYIAVDRELDPPNALFRQRFDGSEHSELIRFRRNAILSQTRDPQGGSVLFNFFPDYSTNAEIQPIYRITDEEGLLTPITPDDFWYTVYTHSDDGWLILNQFESSLSNPKLYRMRPNGEDFALLFELGENDTDIARYITSQNELLVSVLHEDETNTFYRINIETLEQKQRHDDSTGNIFFNFVNIGDNDSVIVQSPSPTQSYLRRLDLNTLEFQTLKDTTNSEMFRILRVNAPYLLVSEQTFVETEYHTEISLLNIYTGDTQHLDTIITDYTDGGFIQRYFPPHSEDEVIISFSNNNSSSQSPTQYRINIKMKDIHRVDFGSNPKFSPIVDNDWKALPLATLGGVLLVVSMGWMGRKYALRSAA